MSRRMQLVNLSLISVGDKQINPGLTSFVHIVAQLDFIKLPCANQQVLRPNYNVSYNVDIVAHI